MNGDMLDSSSTAFLRTTVMRYQLYFSAPVKLMKSKHCVDLLSSDVHNEKGVRTAMILWLSDSFGMPGRSRRELYMKPRQ